MYLTQSLHRNLQQGPGETATVFGDRVRTRRESAQRIARFAGALRAQGVAEGDRVALLSLNSDLYHEYLYAVWWIGGVVNPVNIRWSPREIAFALEESETRVLIVDDTFASMVPMISGLWDGVRSLIHCGEGAAPAGTLSYEQLIADNEPVDDVRAGGERLAGIFYTGGTTGFPKGVMLTHANLIASANSLAVAALAEIRGGRSMHCSPLFHGAALANWLAQEVVGGSHVFVPKFEPKAVLQAIAEHRPIATLLVPSMIQMLVDHPEAGGYDLSSLRYFIYGASPISEAVLERAMKVFPAAGFVQGYGMTEMSPLITVLAPADHGDPRLLRAAGRAAPGVDVRIVDAADEEVPRGTIGQIVTRGANMMAGYWQRPEETADAMRGGWMHTGDAAFMDSDGYVFIVDRVKDMIVSGGENVYSAEVERALGLHAAVAACAVIGVPDAEWGERVHAVVVLQPGAGASAEELRSHCKDRIAGYKAPRTVEFVDALPLSSAGKILKAELRRPHWEGSGRAVG
jgi:acyl-CoA synthetase (AMP-forming)/AMP-acid ligase II